MSDTTTTLRYVCDITGEAKLVESKSGRKVLPRGWRKHGGKTYSDSAWKQYYRCAAVAIPIASPLDGTWEELRESLKLAWSLTTSLSNWHVTQLFASDCHRDSTMEKLSPPKFPYLYPAARERFPNLPTGSLSAVMHAVEGVYRAHRWEINWTCSRALESFRYPTPYPVREQNWTPRLDDEGAPIIACQFPDRRWRLRLRRGHDFRRQVAMFERLVSGMGKHTELAFYRKRANAGDNRGGVSADKASGGGNRAYWTPMVKVVGWWPKNIGRTPTEGKTLRVSTQPDRLLTAVYGAKDDGQQVWMYNVDHLKRKIESHANWLQRLREDHKHENRMDRQWKRQVQHEMDVRCGKQRNRINSVIHEVSANLIGFAQRHHCTLLEYDDTDKSYLVSFPWHQLRTTITTKAEAVNIAVAMTGKESDESAE